MNQTEHIKQIIFTVLAEIQRNEHIYKTGRDINGKPKTLNFPEFMQTISVLLNNAYMMLDMQHG